MKKEIIENQIKKLFSIDEDKHVDTILSSIKGLTNLREIDSSWEDEGKYSYGSMTYFFEYENEKFYVEVGQTRTGSYFTDYYFQDAQLYDIQTDEEYNAPKIAYSFKFKDNDIIIFDNNTASVLNITYYTVEDAINSLL